MFRQRLIIFELGLTMITFDTYFPHILNNFDYYLIVVITDQGFEIVLGILGLHTLLGIRNVPSTLRAFQFNRKPTVVLVKVINQDVKRTNSIS